MTPLAADGKPLDGTDVNGTFKTLLISRHHREVNYVMLWTRDFANNVGGYPQVAIVN
ncbi:hypothetical protein CGLAMM_10250 [Acetobacteraceae bacterium EV16G]|uniref:Uncharacterized protein n=1 Tax=Sorlinia euscelidii TaxID=3081148 RepID=A0ABU7TZZ9_9PROT